MARHARVSLRRSSAHIQPATIAASAVPGGLSINPSTDAVNIPATSVTASSAVGAPAPLVLSNDSVWSDTDIGTDRFPTVTISQDIYPSAAGVRFWLNGIVDERASYSARPDGYDTTGPNEGSTYHMYPSLTLTQGTELAADWTDSSGNTHGTQTTVGEAYGASVQPVTVSARSSVPSVFTSPNITVRAVTVASVASVPDPPVIGAPSDRPTASNTGHDGNLTDTYGSTTITQAWLNTNNGGSLLLENVRFNGRVDVEVDDLTVRNFEVNGGHYGVYNNVFASATTGLVLEDGELSGQGSSALAIKNCTARRLHVHDQVADGFKPFGNVVLEGCYIYDMGNGDIPDAHADGVQMRGGAGLTVRGCNFDMPYTSTYLNSICLIIQAADGPISNVLIENNWINGGGYSITMSEKTAGTHGFPSNARIINNRFGREYQFGPMSFKNGYPAVVSGNVWDDTGLPI